jgi:hypothetical protein
MEYDHPAKSGIEPVRARPDEPELDALDVNCGSERPAF